MKRKNAWTGPNTSRQLPFVQKSEALNWWNKEYTAAWVFFFIVSLLWRSVTPPNTALLHFLNQHEKWPQLLFAWNNSILVVIKNKREEMKCVCVQRRKASTQSEPICLVRPVFPRKYESLLVMSRWPWALTLLAIFAPRSHAQAGCCMERNGWLVCLCHQWKFNAQWGWSRAWRQIVESTPHTHTHTQVKQIITIIITIVIIISACGFLSLIMLWGSLHVCLAKGRVKGGEGRGAFSGLWIPISPRLSWGVIFTHTACSLPLTRARTHTQSYRSYMW